MKSILPILAFIALPLLGMAQVYVDTSLPVRIFQPIYRPVKEIQLPKYDTVKVVMLVSDTAHYIYTYFKVISCEEAKCTKLINKRNTDSIGLTTFTFHNYVHSKEVREDRINESNRTPYWQFGYKIIRKIEPDPFWIGGGATTVPAIPNWLPEPDPILNTYIDHNKQPLKPTIIVWMSVPALTNKQ